MERRGERSRTILSANHRDTHRNSIENPLWNLIAGGENAIQRRFFLWLKPRAIENLTLMEAGFIASR